LPQSLKLAKNITHNQSLNRHAGVFMEKMKSEGKTGGIEESNIQGNLATAVGYLEKENADCGIRDHQGNYGDEKKSKMKEKE
jgi:hypothetical protein